MRSRAGLFLLGLLGLSSSAWGQEIGVLVFCDDPAVQKSVSSALDKFNEDMTSGHKLVLYQILSASKSENGSESEYAVHFTSQKSDCPAGGDKPWTDCGYLLSESQKLIQCNANVHVTDTETDATYVNCQVDDPVVRERAPCLGCPKEIDEDSEELKVPLSASISTYNSMSNSTHLFALHSVGFATRQVVANIRFSIWYDMRKTTCAKSEHQELNDLCVPDDENLEFANCNTTVDVAPWRHDPPEPHNECEPGPMPRSVLLRRRPPGLTPLRTFEISANSTPPTQAAAKEESSEEDTTASKPSGPSDVADSPFHCPSPPWKPPSQAEPDPAPESTDASPQPPAAGTFTDLDLVG